MQTPLTTQIVLFNMLIVMMREYYIRIRENEHDVFLRGRAELIVEVETLMSKREQERYSTMPPFLHLLSQVSPKKASAAKEGAGPLHRDAALPAPAQPGRQVQVFLKKKTLPETLLWSR